MPQHGQLLVTSPVTQHGHTSLVRCVTPPQAGIATQHRQTLLTGPVTQHGGGQQHAPAPATCHALETQLEGRGARMATRATLIVTTYGHGLRPTRYSPLSPFVASDPEPPASGTASSLEVAFTTSRTVSRIKDRKSPIFKLAIDSSDSIRGRFGEGGFAASLVFSDAILSRETGRCNQIFEVV